MSQRSTAIPAQARIRKQRRRAIARSTARSKSSPVRIGSFRSQSIARSSDPSTGSVSTACVIGERAERRAVRSLRVGSRRSADAFTSWAARSWPARQEEITVRCPATLLVAGWQASSMLPSMQSRCSPCEQAISLTWGEGRTPACRGTSRVSSPVPGPTGPDGSGTPDPYRNSDGQSGQVGDAWATVAGRTARSFCRGVACRARVFLVGATRASPVRAARPTGVVRFPALTGRTGHACVTPTGRARPTPTGNGGNRAGPAGDQQVTVGNACRLEATPHPASLMLGALSPARCGSGEWGEESSIACRACHRWDVWEWGRVPGPGGPAGSGTPDPYRDDGDR